MVSIPGLAPMVTRRQFLAAAGLLAGTLYTRRYVEANPGFGAGTSLSNTNVYTRPTAPIWPGAGGSYTDPTFGTKVIQVTDANTGSDCKTVYSYWPCMNSDNTRIKLVIDHSPPYPENQFLFTFNSSTEIVASDEAAFTTIAFAPEMAIWSYSDPNVMYGVPRDLNLYKMTITGAGTRTYTLLKNFSGVIAGATQLWQMTMSSDDRYFGFSVLSGSNVIGMLVWDRTNDISYTNTTSIGTNVDEGYVDLSGTYMVIVPLSGTQGHLWEFVPNTTKAFPSLIKGVHGCIWNKKHFCNGLNSVSAEAGWNVYDLTQANDPLVGVDCMADTTSSGHADRHASWLTPNDGTYVYCETLWGDAIPWSKYQDELLKVWTDGSGKWRRLCHTFSDQTNPPTYYSDTPKASISRDGRWYIWMSNKTIVAGRHDVFIVKVPTEAEFAVGDYGGGGGSRPPVSARPSVSVRPAVLERPPVGSRPSIP